MRLDASLDVVVVKESPEFGTVAFLVVLLNWLAAYFEVYFFGFPVGHLLCFCQLLLIFQYSDFIISAPGTSSP